MDKRLVFLEVFLGLVIGLCPLARNLIIAYELEAALLATRGEETSGSYSHAVPGLHPDRSFQNGDELSSRLSAKRPCLPTTSLKDVRSVNYKSSNQPVSTVVKLSEGFSVLDTSDLSTERAKGSNQPREPMAKIENANSKEIHEQDAESFYAPRLTTSQNPFQGQRFLDELQRSPSDVFPQDRLSQTVAQQAPLSEAPLSVYDMALTHLSHERGLKIPEFFAKKRPCREVFSGDRSKNNIRRWSLRQTAGHGGSTLKSDNEELGTTTKLLHILYHPDIVNDLHRFSDEQPASSAYSDHSGMISKAKSLGQTSDRRKQLKISHLPQDQTKVNGISAKERADMREGLQENSAPEADYAEPFQINTVSKKDTNQDIMNQEKYLPKNCDLQKQKQFRIPEEEIKTKAKVSNTRESFFNGSSMQFSWISTITNDDTYVPTGYMNKIFKSFWRKIHNSLKAKEEVISKSDMRRKKFLSDIPVAISTSRISMAYGRYVDKISVEVTDGGMTCLDTDVEEKVKDLVERVGHISQLALLACGITFHEPISQHEQNYLLSWLEKQMISPENSFPVLGLFNKEGSDHKPEFGNLQKEILKFLSNPKTSTSIKMRKYNDELVFSKYATFTTQVAVRILQTYYKETNPKKWFKYFHNENRFLSVLESISMALINHTFEPPSRDHLIKYKSISGFPWNTVELETDEKSNMEADIITISE